MLYETLHLSKAFKKEVIIRDFNIQIDKGEMIAIVGKKGSGKTTLMQMLAGLVKPSFGEIKTASRVVGDKNSVSAIRKLRQSHIGYVSTEPVLLPELTVFENLLIADKRNPGSNKSKKAKAKETLKKVGLIGRSQYMPSELTQVEKQKVCIARAIMNKPILLFLDEPTASLDAAGAYSVMDVLQRLNSQGLTIVLSTRNKMVATMCQRAVGIDAHTDVTAINKRIAEEYMDAREAEEEEAEEDMTDGISIEEYMSDNSVAASDDDIDMELPQIDISQIFDENK